jgi:hypothetical protein
MLGNFIPKQDSCWWGKSLQLNLLYLQPTTYIPLTPDTVGRIIEIDSVFKCSES